MGNAVKQWIVTANFLQDGGVAYLKADGQFGRKLAEAQPYATKEEAETARVAALKVEREVCDPYLTQVGVGPQGLTSLTARERIREEGPTIRLRRPDPLSVAGR